MRARHKRRAWRTEGELDPQNPDKHPEEAFLLVPNLQHWSQKRTTKKQGVENEEQKHKITGGNSGDGGELLPALISLTCAHL